MRSQRGMTLTELMVGISIVAILLAAATPTFQRWTQDAHNRAAAESVLNGLQLARMESLRRNTAVRFELTDAEGKASWRFGCVAVTADCPAVIQSRSGDEGARFARVGVSAAAIPKPTLAGHFSTPISAGTGVTRADGTPVSVVFDSLGRAPAVGRGVDISRIDITSSVQAKARRYVVTVGPGGQVRMCDPALTFANNSQGCS